MWGMTVEKHDLSSIFDEHVAGEFVVRDVAATMSTMAAEPFVNHVPTMMSAVGARDVAEFYENYFIGHWPEDTEIIPVDRTIGADKVVNEMISSFTHDVQMDAFLPGVPPTGKAVRLPVVAFERVYWDQGSALVQVGLLDGSKLPVTGAVQAEKVLDKNLPANELLKRGG